MENGEAIKKLTGDFLHISGGTRTRCFKIMAQVAVLDIFHRNENAITVLVPAEEFDKEILTLVMVSTNIKSMSIIQVRTCATLVNTKSSRE